jgi:prolyl oligopeptidase
VTRRRERRTRRAYAKPPPVTRHEEYYARSVRTFLSALAILGTLDGCDADLPPPAPATPASVAPAPTPVPLRPAFDYPRARVVDVVDDYHGVKVADPYRWLEDLDAPETRAFLGAENRLTDSVLGALPGRDALRARLSELYRYSKYGLPIHRGARWFWTQRDPGQEQSVVYVAASPDAPPTLLLDPNALSPDGKLAFEGFSVSERGNRMAYGMAAGGGDWQSWRFRDVTTGKDLPDEISGIKYYTPRLTPDGDGVYYSRFPAPEPGKELSETDHDCKVYFHAMGSPVASDVLVYERPEHPSWQFSLELSPGGRYLVIAIGDGEVGDRGQERIVAIDLRRRGARPVALVDTFDAEYVLAGARGTTLYFKTTAGAPRKRVVAIDAAAGPAAFREIVGQGPDAIEEAVVAGDRLVVTTLKDARHALALYDLTGKKVRDVALPGLGTAFVAGSGAGDTEAFFGFETFSAPATIYRHDLARGATTPWKAPKIEFSPADFETTQVFYPSRDGTKIPMFLTSRRGLARDGRNPTLLTGYGGFGVSVTPKLDPKMIAWIERGGVLAVANLRGGGEYGEEWHRAATGERKQVTFDDFIAAAEWLIGSGVTSKDKLGIVGRSGGGLLVAAVEMQRPDLFAAVAPLAGVHDMLRFSRFGQGAGWSGDLGSPDVPRELTSLRAYSPLHNVRPGTSYPATYLVTADHDVRVAPLHSYKLAAAMQAAQAGPRPVLLRVETTSGHGGGTTVSSRVDQSAELLAFFEYALGVGRTP